MAARQLRLSRQNATLTSAQFPNPQSRNSYILLSQAKLAPTGIVIKSAVLSSLRLVPFINLQSKNPVVSSWGNGYRVQGTSHHAFLVLYSSLYLVPCTRILLPAARCLLRAETLCSMPHALCPLQSALRTPQSEFPTRPRISSIFPHEREAAAAHQCSVCGLVPR